MECDWDKNKAVVNLSKQGGSFEEAKTVFDDPLYVVHRVTLSPNPTYGLKRRARRALRGCLDPSNTTNRKFVTYIQEL